MQSIHTLSHQAGTCPQDLTPHSVRMLETQLSKQQFRPSAIAMEAQEYSQKC